MNDKGAGCLSGDPEEVPSAIVTCITMPDVTLVAVAGKGDAITLPWPETELLRIGDRINGPNGVDQVQSREWCTTVRIRERIRLTTQ